MILKTLLLTSLPALTLAGFYGSNDKVVVLDSSNFKSKVLDSDELWLVEFYAPWCGHCKTLTPQWKAAADELDGVVNIGAVDADQHKDLGGKFGIKGFPTIKVFGANKNSPKDYKGGRDSTAIVEESFKELRQMVKDKKSGGKSSGGSSGGGEKKSGGNKKKANGGDVVILTDSNFEDLVMQSSEPFLIEFYAPWCGHCQRLEPEWNEAAAQLTEKTGGKVKVAKMDCTVHQQTCSKFGVQGYPSIKMFKTGAKDAPEEYNAGRTASDIITVGMELFESVRDPPTLRQLVDPEVFSEKCENAQLCLVFVLDHIYDSSAADRNSKLEMLTSLIEKYKGRQWEWFWTEAMAQTGLESLCDISRDGVDGIYPGACALNLRRKVRVKHAGSFDTVGLNELARNLAAGKGGRNTLAFTDLPAIKVLEEWDGKDAAPPVEDDMDLDDFDWDDEPEEEEEARDEL